MQPDLYWVSTAPPARLAMMPRPRSGDWLEDEISGWARAGIGIVVSLLEAHEVRELALSSEATLCGTHGIEFVSFPIPDRGTPKSVQELEVLAGTLASRLQGGTAVAVHCRAGIGRSGLVAACVLLKLGVPFPEVFPKLTAARGVSVPDTSVQEDWVRSFALERSRAL